MGTDGYCCPYIINPQNPNSQPEGQDSDVIRCSRITVVYPSSSDNLLFKLPNQSPKKIPPNSLIPDHSLYDSEI